MTVTQMVVAVVAIIAGVALAQPVIAHMIESAKIDRARRHAEYDRRDGVHDE